MNLFSRHRWLDEPSLAWATLGGDGGGGEGGGGEGGVDGGSYGYGGVGGSYGADSEGMGGTYGAADAGYDGGVGWGDYGSGYGGFSGQEQQAYDTFTALGLQNSIADYPDANISFSFSNQGGLGIPGNYAGDPNPYSESYGVGWDDAPSFTATSESEVGAPGGMSAPSTGNFGVASGTGLGAGYGAGQVGSYGGGGVDGGSFGGGTGVGGGYGGFGSGIGDSGGNGGPGDFDFSTAPGSVTPFGPNMVAGPRGVDFGFFGYNPYDPNADFPAAPGFPADRFDASFPGNPNANPVATQAIAAKNPNIGERGFFPGAAMQAAPSRVGTVGVPGPAPGGFGPGTGSFSGGAPSGVPGGIPGLPPMGRAALKDVLAAPERGMAQPMGDHGWSPAVTPFPTPAPSTPGQAFAALAGKFSAAGVPNSTGFPGFGAPPGVPATPAQPAVPGVSPATPAVPATPLTPVQRQALTPGKAGPVAMPPVSIAPTPPPPPVSQPMGTPSFGGPMDGNSPIIRALQGKRYG